MGRLAIAPCENYDIDRVRDSVRQAVDRLGGMCAFVDRGDRVLLKVNLLMKRPPEAVTTTHPAVAQAVAELVAQAGGIPVIGDSPGGYHFHTAKTLEAVYETCGMTAAAKASGADLNFDTEIVEIPYPQGTVVKNVRTLRSVVQFDKIINLPKIKTHMMTVYSGAVKNLFGIIPGSYKAEYHLRFEDVEVFADLLIDLCRFANPVLTVMDAVIGMEGYGPTNGNPRRVGLVLAGADPFEVDAVATAIIGLKPEQVPTIRRAVARGLWSGTLAGTEILGPDPSEVAVLDFQKPTVQVSFNYYNLVLPKFITRALDRFIKPNPVVDPARCVGCRVCEQSCPPHAISMKDNRAVIDYHACIKCFCCHELCRYDAVSIKRPWFLKLLLK